MKKAIQILVIILLVILIIIGLGVILGWNSPYYERENQFMLDEEDPTYEEIDMDEVLEEPDLAVIEGSLGYPSEFIPPLEICAESLDGPNEHCTYEHLEGAQYTYGEGYKIEVPAGEYQVYAKLLNPDDDYKAYYSDFVTCGLDIECPSHNPIAVTVEAGETVKNIDPIDWYAP